MLFVCVGMVLGAVYVCMCVCVYVFVCVCVCVCVRVCVKFVGKPPYKAGRVLGPDYPTLVGEKWGKCDPFCPNNSV